MEPSHHWGKELHLYISLYEKSKRLLQGHNNSATSLKLKNSMPTATVNILVISI